MSEIRWYELYRGKQPADRLYRAWVAVFVVGLGLTLGTFILADMAMNLAGIAASWWLWTLGAGIGLLTRWGMNMLHAAEERAYDRE